MIYKHRIYRETRPFVSLATVASAVAAQKAGLPYQPVVHYFKEADDGRWARQLRVLGFPDRGCGCDCFPDYCIFVRERSGPDGPAEIVRTIFHETYHVREFFDHDVNGKPYQHTAAAEAAAEAFAGRYGAYSGDVFEITKKLREAYVPLDRQIHRQRSRMRQDRAEEPARRQRQRELERSQAKHWAATKDERMRAAKRAQAEAAAKALGVRVYNSVDEYFYNRQS